MSSGRWRSVGRSILIVASLKKRSFLNFPCSVVCHRSWLHAETIRDVDLALPGASHRVEFLFFHDPEDLGLDFRVEVDHFVEEERAAVRDLQQAFLAFRLGAGEGAFLVAEEFAFDDFRAECGAVQGHERIRGPGAPGVDEPCEKLFSHAAFPLDEHPRIAALSALYGEHLGVEEPRVLSDQPVHPLEPLDFLAEPVHLVFQAGMLECVLDGEFELIEVHGLNQVVEGSALYREDHVPHPFVGGDHDHGRRRAKFLEPRQEFEAAAVREADVEEHQVRLFAFGQFDARSARVRFYDDVVLFQQTAQSGPERRFIINDEDLVLFAHAELPVTGNHTRKKLKEPGEKRSMVNRVSRPFLNKMMH